MNDLVQKIHNVDFEITFDCNIRCLHCYNETHKKKGELSFTEILRTINQIKDLGFHEIHINGGEPLKHPKVSEILEHCDSVGLSTLLETNGTLLTKELIERLKKIKKLKIRASIDGHEAIHNEIRRSAELDNPYLSAIDGLNFARNSGIPVQITTSVNKINCAHLIELVADLYNKLFDDIRLRLSMPSSSGYVHWQILKLDSSEMQIVREQVKYIQENYPTIKFNGDSIFRLLPRQEKKMFITPHGNVKPYPFIETYVGNVKNETLIEILSNYDKITYPKRLEKMMNEYLIELGMGESHG